MPFLSQAQRGYMYSKHPEIAKRWEAETPANAKLPQHVKKKTKGAASPETIAAKAFAPKGE